MRQAYDYWQDQPGDQGFGTALLAVRSNDTSDGQHTTISIAVPASSDLHQAHTLSNLDNQNVDTGMKQTTRMMATYTTSVIRKAAPPQVRQHSANQAKTATCMHIGVEVATQPRL